MAWGPWGQRWNRQAKLTDEDPAVVSLQVERHDARLAELVRLHRRQEEHQKRACDERQGTRVSKLG